MAPIRVKSMHSPSAFGYIVAFTHENVDGFSQTLAIVVSDSGGITEDVFGSLCALPQTIGNAELAMKAGA